MKRTFIILSTFAFACTQIRNSSRSINLVLPKWTFEIPNELGFADSAFDIHGQLTKEIPENNSSLRLFLINSDGGSFAAYISHDTLDEKEWKKYHDDDTKWYFDEMRQLSNIKVLDTKYTSKNINNTNFLIQYVKFIKTSTTDTVHLYHHFGKQGKFGIDISFEYFNEHIGHVFESILSSSTFQN